MSPPGKWLKSLAGEGGGGGPQKAVRKKMWWLAGAVFLGVGLIILGNMGSPPPQTEQKNAAAIDPPADRPALKSRMAVEEEALAARLQGLLERIEGAGSVRVTIRLASSAREDYAVNTTTGKKTTVEKDQGGGARTINENSDSVQVVIARDGKGDSPVVEMETASKVAGVLVVSGGAANPAVRERLFEATRVALNVDPHRIVVLPSGGGVR